MKIHSRHLHAPLCVIFAPNSGYIARYAPFIWHKSPTNCDAHLSESNFQTRSRAGMIFQTRSSSMPAPCMTRGLSQSSAAVPAAVSKRRTANPAP
ncbi:hypothetical protein D3Z50_00805 [Clostridiaceae bacterium]|nr:hypothetical protein [Clostridiaceae bacterium]